MPSRRQHGTTTRSPDSGRASSRRETTRVILVTALLCGAAFGMVQLRSACADPPGAAALAARWLDQGHGVLRDTQARQEWQQADNGEDIDWNAARAYCEGKAHGWRLPRLAELKSLYDPHAAGVPCAQAMCRVPAPFHLSGSWFWSATQVGKDSSDGDELAWGLQLANGAETQAVRDAAYGSRALCVRDP